MGVSDPLVTYRLGLALDDCPSLSEWDHLIHLCRTAVGLLEQGSHEAAQALSSVILTTVTDKLDVEYGDSGQRFGSNIRRPRPVKDEPSGRDFIRQHSWVHIADDWLILPAVNSHFDRSDRPGSAATPTPGTSPSMEPTAPTSTGLRTPRARQPLLCPSSASLRTPPPRMRCAA